MEHFQEISSIRRNNRWYQTKRILNNCFSWTEKEVLWNFIFFFLFKNRKTLVEVVEFEFVVCSLKSILIIIDIQSSESQLRINGKEANTFSIWITVISISFLRMSLIILSMEISRIHINSTIIYQSNYYCYSRKKTKIFVLTFIMFLKKPSKKIILNFIKLKIRIEIKLQANKLTRKWF